MERRNYIVTISDSRNHTVSAQIAALHPAEALCIAGGYAFRELQRFNELVESDCWIATVKRTPLPNPPPHQTRSG